MVDRLRFTIPAPDSTPDPVTGERSMVTLYEGPGEVATFEGYEKTVEAADADYTTTRRIFKIPVSAPTPPRNAVAVVLASPTDPAQVGSTYRVMSEHRETFATAQRIPVEKVV